MKVSHLALAALLSGLSSVSSAQDFALIAGDAIGGIPVLGDVAGPLVTIGAGTLQNILADGGVLVLLTEAVQDPFSVIPVDIGATVVGLAPLQNPGEFLGSVLPVPLPGLESY